jgi:glycosyltransferase involved in cell wall biosynthesis
MLLELKRWQLLWRAIRDYDIIHFNFGRSIFPSRLATQVNSIQENYPNWISSLYRLYARLLNMNDIPLLHLANKGIIVTFQGDDARQGDFCRTNFKISFANEVNHEYYTAEGDSIKQQIIAKFTQYADRIFYLNPDLGYVLPSTAFFLPYAHIDLRDWRQHSVVKSNIEKPVLVHAPSHRDVKGTRYILEAVNSLQNEGVEFDFALIEGMSHAEARYWYEQADILVDQLLGGWYGGLAVELMALGKPVICYIREDDLKFISQQMRDELPIINATPTTFYDVLKEWLTVRKQEIPERGQQSRAYVEKWHDPLKIAAKLKNEYEIILDSKRSKNRAT